jgi:alkylation response protein AidB-like acyl-CoA dehydrogenase
MSDYRAPVSDMQFVLEQLAGLGEVAKLPGCEEATPDLVRQVLEESARVCSEVLAPLTQEGDRRGSVLENGVVTTPPGFREAYRQFVEGGWNALPFPPEFGGQGLPRTVATPVMEMWQAANLSFSLCPLLATGAVEALLLRGTEAQQRTYLPKMVEGSWTGTMNLTEPQAGSDLGLIKTRAERQADGTYRLRGQKIFITYGDHDLTENVVHLVLARTPDAPEGVRGISLFIVPKFLVNADGSLGARNDVKAASLEHKMGIHASPTAVMMYGEQGGAVGYLVGEENRGLEYMFIMMNAARFAVGLQGVAIAERAYQQALAYAKERVQSRDVAGSTGAVPIIRHPDVRRMLMSMKAQAEAMRALAYVVAAAMDQAHRHPDKAERAKRQAFVDLMIPVVKGWSTETGVEVASTGIQVHGGMGFIEETGAAQHLRDARITTIYEGTTGIQANDLIGRKIARDGGAAAKALVQAMRSVEGTLPNLKQGIDAFAECVEWLVPAYSADIKAAHAGSVPFLMLMGTVAGGWQMARASQAAQRLLDGGSGDADFLKAKIATARFYAEHVLPRAKSLRDEVVAGAASVLELADDQF